MDLNEAGKFQAQFNAAILQFAQTLRDVPAFLPDKVGDQPVEAKDHFKFALAGMNAETIAQTFCQGKLPRKIEFFFGQFDGANARRHKGPNVFAQMTVGKQKPFAVDVREMVGVHQTGFRLLAARFAVSEDQLFVARGGFGQCVKDFQIEDRLGAGPK